MPTLQRRTRTSLRATPVESKTQARRPSMPGGRLVDPADDALQSQCQAASFLLREEAAQLALAAGRLDREPARVQACCRAAQFNLRPVPREHDALAAAALARFDADLRLGDRDRLAVEAPLERGAERPRQQRHLQSRERQHRPEALAGEYPGGAYGHDARGGEEQPRAALRERAVGTDLDAQRFRFHARPMVACERANSSRLRCLSAAA